MEWVKKAVIAIILAIAILGAVIFFDIWPFHSAVRNDERPTPLPAAPRRLKTSSIKHALAFIKASSVSYNACQSEKCAWIGRKIVTLMNEKVDPCENFYDFACGNWMEHNRNIYGDWSRAQDLYSDILKKLLEIIKYAVDVSDPMPVKVAKQFFQACQEDDLNRESQLKILSEKYTKNVGVGTLDTVIGQIHRDMYPDCIFFTYISDDEGNKSGQDNVYYIDSRYNDARRTKVGEGEEEQKIFLNAYTNFIQNGWQLFFPNSLSKDANRIAKEIIAFENELDKISTVPDGDGIDQTEYYHLFSIPELNDLTKNTHIFNWERYFSGYFKDDWPNPMANLDTFKVVVKDLQFVKKMGNLLEKTLQKSPHVIGNYLKWVIINFYGDDASRKYMDILQAYISDSAVYHISQPYIKSSRELQCWMSTTNSFGMAISYLYLKKFVPDNLFLRQVKEMASNIQQKFYELLKGSKWILSEKTRNRILERVKTMRTFAGFPDVFKKLYWKNATSPKDFDAVLNEYFKYLDVSMGNNHLHNSAQVVKWMLRERRAMLNNPKNPERWRVDPFVPNAHYVWPENAIVLQVANIQPPFYFPDIPIQALNFGTLGHTIGHEFSHGLNHIERKLDEKGTLNFIWDKGTIESFKERKKCFALQYGNYSVEEISDIYGEPFWINGTQTLDENFADNIGLSLSYEAYKDYLAKHKSDTHFHGLKYSPEKLFFIAFAQAYCGVYNEHEPNRNKDMELLVHKTNTHSPYRFRVMGALANSPDFSDVWNCRKPSNRNICPIW